jgi:hypothetical protein
MTDTQKLQENKQIKIDHLTEDTPIAGQNYVCVSFVSPEGIKNCNIRSFKIRGVFSNYEEAKQHAETLQKKDPVYHVFVGEMGKWLPWDPHPDSAKDQHYYESQLQKLHEGYIANREKAKRTEAERKQDMIKRTVADTADTDRNVSARTEMKKKVEAMKLKKETEKYTPSLEERNKIVEKEKERVSNNQNKVVETENKLKSIDDNIAKIKDLWSKQKQNKNK